MRCAWRRDRSHVRGLRPHSMTFAHATPRHTRPPRGPRSETPYSPGVFVVFRDKLAEQTFLANRHRRAHDISHLLSLLDHSPRDKRDKEALLLEEHSGLIRLIWAETLRLGRLPDPAELDPDTSEKIANRLGSIREAVRLAQTAFGTDALNQARASRIDDLKVYFSLNLFSRRKAYRVLPVELQRDVKAFFGSYKSADSAGRETLFSVGNPSTIAKACEQASKNGLGFLYGDHSLQLDASLVDRLPAPFARLYRLWRSALWRYRRSRSRKNSPPIG